MRKAHESGNNLTFETDTHRQTDRHRQTERQTETERHTHTEADRQKGRQTDRQVETGTERDKWMDSETDTDRAKGRGQTESSLLGLWIWQLEQYHYVKLSSKPLEYRQLAHAVPGWLFTFMLPRPWSPPLLIGANIIFQCLIKVLSVHYIPRPYWWNNKYQQQT